MTPAEPAILARGLTRRFGAFTAVDGVTFEVERGEIFGYLGANGAGKSTTIRMLCGLLSPTSGGGTVAGFDIAAEAERCHRVGLVHRGKLLLEGEPRELTRGHASFEELFLSRIGEASA